MLFFYNCLIFVSTEDSKYVYTSYITMSFMHPLHHLLCSHCTYAKVERQNQLKGPIGYRIVSVYRIPCKSG